VCLCTAGWRAFLLAGAGEQAGVRAHRDPGAARLSCYRIAEFLALSGGEDECHKLFRYFDFGDPVATDFPGAADPMSIAASGLALANPRQPGRTRAVWRRTASSSSFRPAGVRRRSVHLRRNRPQTGR
jgi:hypothetical protein